MDGRLFDDNKVKASYARETDFFQSQQGEWLPTASTLPAVPMLPALAGLPAGMMGGLPVHGTRPLAS